MLTKPDKGWAWVVMVASFGAHVITGCFLYAVGVIHNSLLDRFNEDVVKTSWAGAVYLTLCSLTGLASSIIINRYSCRVSMIIGGLLMSTGFAASALLPSLNWVIVSYGVIGGIGQGLCYSAHIIVLGFNFQTRRNFASGIAVSGCGFGTLALAPVMEATRERYGNSGFFFILAGISLHMVLFGSMFFPTELEEIRKRSHSKRILEKRLEEHKYKIYLKILSCIKYFKILRKLSFTVLCLSMFFANIGIYLIYVHFARYMIVMKSTPLQASYLLSINGLCNCVSRILAGMASNAHNVDELVIYFGTFGALGLSTVLFPLYSSTFAGQAAYSCFLGLYSGCCYAVLNTLVVQFVGLEKLATGFGVVMIFTGTGTFLGPPLAGFIVDNGGSYERSFVIGGFAILLGSLLGMSSVCFGGREEIPYCKDTEIVLEKDVPTVAKSSLIHDFCSEHREYSSTEENSPLNNDKQNEN